MQIDHLAFRCKNRHDMAKMFIEMCGYKYHTEFDLKFDDGTTTDCLVLVPEESKYNPPRVLSSMMPASIGDDGDWEVLVKYQLPPEIFISDGPPESIVGQFVSKYGNSLHHIAFAVAPNSIEAYIKAFPAYEWLSKEPIVCDGLRQIFVKMPGTNLTVELIEREAEGFCRDSVKKLMESTK